MRVAFGEYQLDTETRTLQREGQRIPVQSKAFSWKRVRPRGLNVLAGSTLAGAGKFSSQVVWDPAGPVPEGDIR
jgi:hypothetical protein